MTAAYRAACPDAVHVLTPEGKWLRAGAAATWLLGAIGYRRLAWFLGLPVARWFVERGYEWVAGHRLFLSKFLFTKE